jgi:hypothetical protein
VVKKILYILLLTTCFYYGYSQSTLKSINIGVSKSTGIENRYWKLGPSLAAQIFYTESTNILFGGRIAINRWNSDEEELTRKFNGNTEGINIDSYGLIFEFTPGIRYRIKQIKHNINFFSQAGFGLYHINFRTSKIFENNLGLNLGFIFVLLVPPKIQPEISILYHIIFRKKEPISYLSLHTGIIF